MVHGLPLNTVWTHEQGRHLKVPALFSFPGSGMMNPGRLMCHGREGGLPIMPGQSR